MTNPCYCTEGKMCQFCKELDGSEYEIFQIRKCVDDIYLYRSELRSIKDATGGCSCHLGHAPCSSCTADMEAYTNVVDEIEAEIAFEKKAALAAAALAEPESFGMLFAESVYNPTASPVTRWGGGYLDPFEP